MVRDRLPVQTNITNYHVQYMDITSQYWNPNSADYAGGDNLITVLAEGYDVEKCTLRRHTYAPSRFVDIYVFHLKRESDNEELVMPVLNNPYIQRFIRENDIEVEDTSS
mgnify:CR=1 FL=1